MGSEESNEALASAADESSEKNETDAPDGPIFEAQAPPPVGEDPPIIHTFSQTFTLTVTQVRANGDLVNLDENCVEFGSEKVVQILEGKATADWTGSQELVLGVWDVGGAGRLKATEAATGPLELVFSNIIIYQSSTLGLVFGVSVPDGSVAAAQSVDMTIEFAYYGSADAAGRLAGCAL